MPFDVSAYETVTSLERLDEWVAAAREQGFVAVDTETSSSTRCSADLVGFSLALEPGKACYVPLQHRERLRSLRRRPRAGPDPDRARRSHAIRPLLEDASVLKIGQNLKYDWLVLKRYGIEVAPFDDTMLISYVLDAGQGLARHGRALAAVISATRRSPSTRWRARARTRSPSTRSRSARPRLMRPRMRT